MSWVKREMTVVEKKTSRVGKVSKRSRPTKDLYIIKFNDGTEWTGGRLALELEFSPSGNPEVGAKRRSAYRQAVEMMTTYLEGEDGQVRLLINVLGHLSTPLVFKAGLSVDAYEARRVGTIREISRVLSSKVARMRSAKELTGRLNGLAEFDDHQRKT
jgi:hypothetical protein